MTFQGKFKLARHIVVHHPSSRNSVGKPQLEIFRGVCAWREQLILHRLEENTLYSLHDYSVIIEKHVVSGGNLCKVPTRPFSGHILHNLFIDGIALQTDFETFTLHAGREHHFKGDAWWFRRGCDLLATGCVINVLSVLAAVDHHLLSKLLLGEDPFYPLFPRLDRWNWIHSYHANHLLWK